MITEFFGCPGCGKTYLVESLSGGDVYKNVTPSSGIAKQIKNIGKCLLTYTPYASEIRKVIMNNVTVAPFYKGQYTQRTLRKSVRNISMLASVYKYMNREMYIDEGIVHRVISLCIDQNMTKQTAADIISSLHYVWDSVKVYYLDTSLAVCHESIVSRGRKQAGIDFLNDEEVIKMLDSYYDYCEFICSIFGFQRISRNSVGEIE